MSQEEQGVSKPAPFRGFKRQLLPSLQPEVRTALRQDFGEAELPRNALYGDGTPTGARSILVAMAELSTPL